MAGLCACSAKRPLVTYHQGNGIQNSAAVDLKVTDETVYNAALRVLRRNPQAIILMKNATRHYISAVKDFQSIEIDVQNLNSGDTRLRVTSDGGKDSSQSTDEAMITVHEICNEMGVTYRMDP